MVYVELLIDGTSRNFHLHFGDVFKFPKTDLAGPSGFVFVLFPFVLNEFAYLAMC